MKVIVFGGAGFIGTNLAIELVKNPENEITLVDKSESFFRHINELNLRVNIKEMDFSENTDFDSLLSGQDIVYHLVSSTVPTTSNQHIADELKSNVVVTACLLDACVRTSIKKVVFVSSGGTVYGKESGGALKESTPTNPISSYGVQKITIEKLLYLYKYMFGLDYRIIRLANPYGPYQRPNGILGAVTTFTYKALKKEPITVFGDGSVIRDFIYIDDAINGILNIVEGDSHYKTFNLGCGYGTSIKQVLGTVQEALGIEMDINYKPGRMVDVPENFLDISRYESVHGKLDPLPLKDGIVKTANFMSKNYI